MTSVLFRGCAIGSSPILGACLHISTLSREARAWVPLILDFLIGENRLDDAQQVAARLSNDHANDPRLIGLADRQLRAGHADHALQLWDIASGFPPLDPVSGRILTNGDLARAPQNVGFDWHLIPNEGVIHRWRPSELLITLSGTQSEACVLLEQTVDLADRALRLRFDYLAPGISGLHWALDNSEGPALAPSEDWVGGVFYVPRTRGLSRLRLFYRRQTGTTRAEGRFEIRNLRLEAL